MKNTFKIQIQHHGQTTSIELDHGDVPMDELAIIFKQLALSMGYQPNTVAEYITTE